MNDINANVNDSVWNILQNFNHDNSKALLIVANSLRYHFFKDSLLNREDTLKYENGLSKSENEIQLVQMCILLHDIQT